MARLIKNFFSQIFFQPEKIKRNFKSFKPEVLFLEDRTVPAVVTVEPNGLVQFQMTSGDNLTNLYSNISGSTLSLNIEGSTITNALPPQVTQVGNLLNIDVSQINNFSGLNFFGSSLGNSIIVNQSSSNIGLDLKNLAIGSANQSINFDLSQAVTNSLTIQTQIIPKASGNVSLISPLTFLPNGLNVVGGTSTILYLGGKIIADSNISFPNDISKVELSGPVTLDLRGNSTFSIPSTVDPTSADYPIRLIGTGKLLLTGDSSATLGNNFLVIENGSLEVNSPGKLSSVSTISIIGGILTGNGIVGKVVATGGVFDLTASTITNKLTPTSVSLSGNSILKVALNSNSDQNFQILEATGNVSISGNSVLQVSNFTTNETNLKSLIEKKFDVIKSSTMIITGMFSNPFQRSSVVIQSGINKGTTLSFSISPLSISPPVNKTLQVQLVFFSPPTQGATFVNPPQTTQVQESSVFGAGPGGGPLVKVYSNSIQYQFFAYQDTFTGGVQVAKANLFPHSSFEVGSFVSGIDELTVLSMSQGLTIGSPISGPGLLPGTTIKSFANNIITLSNKTNGVGGGSNNSYNSYGLNPDIITVPGPGGSPHVKIFTFENNGYVLKQEFFALDQGFTGGSFVAAGDISGDSQTDIIIGAGPGGGPRVQVFFANSSGINTSPNMNFFAYDSSFLGGVVVSAGNRFDNKLNQDEIITAPASNGGFNIKSFRYTDDSSVSNLIIVDDFFVNNDNKNIGGLSIAVAKFKGGVGVLDDICVAINLPVLKNSNVESRVLGIIDSISKEFTQILTDSLFPIPGFPETISIGVGKDNILIVNSGPKSSSYVGFYTYNDATKVFNLNETSLIFDAEFKGGLFSVSNSF